MPCTVNEPTPHRPVHHRDQPRRHRSTLVLPHLPRRHFRLTHQARRHRLEGLEPHLPGDWAGQGHLGLWARNQSTGDLCGYTFTTGTVTDDFGNSTSYPTLTGVATDTKIGYGVTTAN
ncbi:hypothetical protein ACGF07_32950 [Kitasatospora sp. NPDC048194]